MSRFSRTGLTGYSREQVPKGFVRGGGGPALGLPFNLDGVFVIEIDHDENGIVSRFVFSQKHQGGRFIAGDEGELGVGPESGMPHQEGIEPSEFGDLIGVSAPVEAGSAVNLDAGSGEPLDAGGDSEATGMGAEGRQGGAHPGVGHGGGCQAEIVVSFGEMNLSAFGSGYRDGLGEDRLDIRAVVVLKEFRVGPVQVGAVEQVENDPFVAAQALEEKDGIGKLQANFGRDVAPDGQRDHVAGVATESVYAHAAPEKKDFGHVLPEILVAIVQFGQIGPDDAPGSRRFELVFLVPAFEPFGMMILQPGSPSGVIDGDVEEEPSAAAMGLVEQFLKLLQGRGLAIELGQGGIDPHETERREGTAETSHSCVGGGRREDREELNDLEAEIVHDMIELGDEVSKLARARNDFVAGRLQLNDSRTVGSVLRSMGAIGTELADKGRVDGRGAGVAGRLHLDHNVVALGPARRLLLDRFSLREKEGLGLEAARLQQGQGEAVAVLAQGGHR